MLIGWFNAIAPLFDPNMNTEQQIKIDRLLPDGWQNDKEVKIVWTLFNKRHWHGDKIAKRSDEKWKELEYLLGRLSLDSKIYSYMNISGVTNRDTFLKYLEREAARELNRIAIQQKEQFEEDEEEKEKKDKRNAAAVERWKQKQKEKDRQ